MENTNIPKPEEKKHRSNQTNLDTPSQIVGSVGKGAHISSDNENPANNKKQHWLNNWSNESIIGLATLGTLVAYICVSTIQIYQTKRVIVIADSANSYTRRVVGLTETNSRMDLRAYIVVNGIATSSDEMKPIRWSIKGTNTGKTPAYDLFGYSRWGFKISEIANFMNDTLKKGVEKRPMMQGNGLGFEFIFGGEKDTIPLYFYQELAKKGVPQFVYGYLQYRDVFNKTHHTRFCYYLDSSLNFLMYKRYNDGD